VRYGDPFDSESHGPYDVFDFNLQLGPQAGASINEVQISGLLTRHFLPSGTEPRFLLGVFQHYDYADIDAFKWSGQSVSAALLSRFTLGSKTRLRVEAHAEALLLGGISSDYGNFWRRDYDLGPGAGTRLNAALQHNGQDRLRVDTRLVWIHSLHGADADHLASFVRLRTEVPLGASLGLGGEFGVTTRRSFYQNASPVRRSISQLRTYLVWTLL
jgi:hypothetical protein